MTEPGQKDASIVSSRVPSDLALNDGLLSIKPLMEPREEKELIKRQAVLLNIMNVHLANRDSQLKRYRLIIYILSLILLWVSLLGMM